MQNTIQPLLSKYVSKIIDIYGSHLKKVILYGSYARGDFHEFSDIDIMILVDLEGDEIPSSRSDVYDAAFEIGYDNDVIINPIIQNIDHFNKWVSAYPFYNNVNNEGVELYDAA